MAAGWVAVFERTSDLLTLVLFNSIITMVRSLCSLIMHGKAEIGFTETFLGAI